MFFKKLFVGFTALFICFGCFNLLFSQERPELKFRLYKVKKGDTLWRLCRYNWEIAAQINNVDPNNLKPGILLMIPSNWDLAKERFNYQLIIVEVEKRTLKFFENGQLKMEFPVRVGKKETPTPIGTGIIYIKRKKPVFRYTEGPKKGEVILYSRLKDGRLVKIPTKDMRALGLFIHKDIRYSIHSTTEEDTIGLAVSYGCIGMKIKDMLSLYPCIEVGAKIVIKPQ